MLGRRFLPRDRMAATGSNLRNLLLSGWTPPSHRNRKPAVRRVLVVAARLPQPVVGCQCWFLRRPQCGGVSPGCLPVPGPPSPGSSPPRTGSSGLQDARQRGRTLFQVPRLFFFLWPVDTISPWPRALPVPAPALCLSRSFRIQSSAIRAVAAGVFSRNEGLPIHSAACSNLAR